MGTNIFHRSLGQSSLVLRSRMAHCVVDKSTAPQTRYWLFNRPTAVPIPARREALFRWAVSEPFTVLNITACTHGTRTPISNTLA